MNAKIRPIGPPPPCCDKEDPAAWGADRAWVGAENPELPTSVNAGSVGPSCQLAAPVFLADKAEGTSAGPLAIAGSAMLCANLADGPTGYISNRWGRPIDVMASLDAVGPFADSMRAPGAAGDAV